MCVIVPNFIKIDQTVAKIWQFNGFQNGGRPPSWICWAPIATSHDDHLMVSIVVQNLVKINAVVSITCSFGLKTPIHAPKLGFSGDFTPKMGSNVNETPKGTSLREFASFEPSVVKIRRRVVIFHPFAQKPPSTDLQLIYHSRRGRGRNHLYQIFGDRSRGVDSVGVENCQIVISY